MKTILILSLFMLGTVDAYAEPNCLDIACVVDMAAAAPNIQFHDPNEVSPLVVTAAKLGNVTPGVVAMPDGFGSFVNAGGRAFGGTFFGNVTGGSIPSLQVGNATVGASSISPTNLQKQYQGPGVGDPRLSGPSAPLAVNARISF